MGMEESGWVVIWKEAFVPTIFFQNKRLTFLQFCKNGLYLEVNIIWKGLRNLYGTDEGLRIEPVESPQVESVKGKIWFMLL